MLTTIIKKIKIYFAYALTVIGIFYTVKTSPSAFYKILYYFNIENVISLDLTNCQTFAFSIIKADFFYPVFILSTLSGVIGLLLLFRERSYSIRYTHWHASFAIMFIVVVFFNLGLLIYIYLLMVEDFLFDKHIIFPIAFIMGCFTHLLFTILLILIWFDNNWSLFFKIISLIILSLLSVHICFRILSFINFYALIGQNPEIFFEAFNYILEKLKIGVFCMNENPCEPLFKQMQQYCDLARGAKSIPRIPVGGGTPTTKLIARLMNIFGTTTKIQTQHDCNDARDKYKACLEIFGVEN
jgi:hypothetical protein